MTTYKGYSIETVNKGTNEERSIATLNGQPAFGSQSDCGKFNSLEKIKIKIDNKSKN